MKMKMGMIVMMLKGGYVNNILTDMLFFIIFRIIVFNADINFIIL